MKIILLGLLALTSLSASASCEKLAEKAVLKAATKNNEGWEIMETNCLTAENKKVNLCEVFGSHEDGAGTKSFLVVLSLDCRAVLEVRLTGEE